MSSADPLASPAAPPAPITWPDGVTAAACLTFDMDAEAAILTADITSVHRMTPMSHQSYGPLVADELQVRLAPYDIYEATVLTGLNEHLNCVTVALGYGRPNTVLRASALSHVCGRTLRDWGATSGSA